LRISALWLITSKLASLPRAERSTIVAEAFDQSERFSFPGSCLLHEITTYLVFLAGGDLGAVSPVLFGFIVDHGWPPYRKERSWPATWFRNIRALWHVFGGTGKMKMPPHSRWHSFKELQLVTLVQRPPGAYPREKVPTNIRPNARNSFEPQLRFSCSD
jgi:hypothetical protein